MIEVTHRIFENIPYIELVESSLKTNCLPTVVFYHGWDSVKEQTMTHGYELAKRGIRTILPEAIYHGERMDALPTTQHYLEFWKIIAQNIEEYPILMEEYINKGLTDKNRLGVTGLSMGGITTCGLMSCYDNIKSAVCLMGTPAFVNFTEGVIEQALPPTFELTPDLNRQLGKLKEIDLTIHPERINHRPFLFWHGTEDDTVPYEPTFSFYENIEHEKFADNVSFTTTNDGHKVPYQISQQMADFFKETL